MHSQKEKDCTETLKVIMLLSSILRYSITQITGKHAGKKASFLKMEKSPPLKLRSEKVSTALLYSSRHSGKKIGN